MLQLLIKEGGHAKEYQKNQERGMEYSTTPWHGYDDR